MRYLTSRGREKGGTLGKGCKSAIGLARELISGILKGGSADEFETEKRD